MVNDFKHRQTIRQITLSGKDEIRRILAVMDSESKSAIRANVKIDGTINRVDALKPIKDRYSLSWSELDVMATMIAKETPQQRYDAANTVQFKMKLNAKTDADIIAWLNVQESKQGKIKELIRKEINEGA